MRHVNFFLKINPNDNCRKKSIWMNNGINSTMRKRLHLWNANKRSGWSKTDLAFEYRKVKKECENKINDAVRDFEIILNKSL